MCLREEGTFFRMLQILIWTLPILLVLTSKGHLLTAEPITVTMAFYNITPDKSEDGFFQIFVVTSNASVVSLQARNSILNRNELIVNSAGTFFNDTHNLEDLQIVGTPVRGVNYHTHYDGVLVSADSDVYVYGVNIDKGSSDGFLALPLTMESKEFYIAGWPVPDQTQFFAGLQIITPFPETCYEIYQINHTSGEMTLLTAQYSGNQRYEFFELHVHNKGDDYTGYLVNGSRPMAVISGHSCGFVPDGVRYCDHMVEQIPPVSELGYTHIVPEIDGRSARAGYTVRVVATQPDTTISWESAADSTVSGTVTLRHPGFFQQFQSPSSKAPMRVICSKPCVVMQYNNGRASVTPADSVATDPFMMLTAPVERFDSSSGFATATFYNGVTSPGTGMRVDFLNYATVVTKDEFRDSIRFDGRPVPSAWLSHWGYSHTSFSVTHGYHVFTTVGRSDAVFGAYAYGHSAVELSSGGYGYTASFRVNGNRDDSLWMRKQKEIEEEKAVAQCSQERISSGLAVASHPTPASPAHIPMKFSLQKLQVRTSSTLSPKCLKYYQDELKDDLLALSRRVNYMICNKTLCPYMTGAPLFAGVPVNTSQPLSILNDQELYVAINTADLANSVQIQVSNGAITGIDLTVPYLGIKETNHQAYTKCRVEVRKYMSDFSNWPKSTSVFPDLTSRGCPKISFDDPLEFEPKKIICPTQQPVI